MWLRSFLWVVLAVTLLATNSSVGEDPEAERFEQFDFTQDSPTTRYYQCARLLSETRFTGHLESFANSDGQIETVQWYRRRLSDTRQLLIQVKGYGFIREEDNEPRYFMTNAEVINFGIVPSDFDLTNSPQMLIGPTDQQWTRHVEKKNELELRKALKVLGVNNPETEIESAQGRPKQYSVRFQLRSERDRLAPVFSNFRGVNVSLLYDSDDVMRPDNRTPSERALANNTLFENLTAVCAFSTGTVSRPDESCLEEVTSTPDDDPTEAQVEFTKLGGHLPRSIKHLISKPLTTGPKFAGGFFSMPVGWNSRYSALVTVKSHQVARELKLGNPKRGLTYRVTWSLRRIAIETKNPGVVFIELDNS